jgi:hypothetical protein
LSGQGAHDLHDLRLEGDDLFRHALGGQPPGSAGAFAVDELEHADDVAGVGGHREDEDRLGKIAVLLVEGRIDRVLGVGGEVVGVVDDERLPGQGDVAGQTLLRDRQHALFEVDVDGGVLGELPAQHFPLAHVVE